MILPTFATSAEPAIDLARAAEDAGLDGVFAYDHLWPMGRPGRPALSPWPVLGAIAALTRSIRVGTLVARVGLLPEAALIAALRTLEELSCGRLVAGLGTGDAKSAAENDAYGLTPTSADERRAELARVARALRDDGSAVWVGGGSPPTDALAREQGLTLNVWGVTAPVVREARSRGVAVSWAGPLPRDPGEAAALLSALADAGASDAVFPVGGDLSRLLEAARSGLGRS